MEIGYKNIKKSKTISITFIKIKDCFLSYAWQRHPLSILGNLKYYCPLINPDAIFVYL